MGAVNALLLRVLRLPKRWSVAVIVGTSVLLSVAFIGGMAITFRFDAGETIWSLAVAVLVPVVVATPVARVLLDLLHSLEALRAQAQSLANADPLTGAFNRRRFIELAEAHLARAAHDRQPVSVLLLDIDDFKRVNDRHGHQAGDQVLKAVAACCVRALRPGDLFARWGGEEFVALLPTAGKEDAFDIARRLRDGVARAAVHVNGQRIAVHDHLHAHRRSAGWRPTRFLPLLEAFTARRASRRDERHLPLGSPHRVLPRASRPRAADSRRLAELGELCLKPEANIIKLPNSALRCRSSRPRSRAEGPGLRPARLPDEPKSQDERDARARYDR
jgi:diguanylate cyclase (GGDEF)-like protein